MKTCVKTDWVDCNLPYSVLQVLKQAGWLIKFIIFPVCGHRGTGLECAPRPRLAIAYLVSELKLEK